jgi:hypothetical protein
VHERGHLLHVITVIQHRGTGTNLTLFVNLPGKQIAMAGVFQKRPLLDPILRDSL